MTVTEAAKRIGISVSKVYQLVTARRIAHYRVGAKIIISDSDVAAFLETCRVGTATAAAPTRPSTLNLRHIKLK